MRQSIKFAPGFISEPIDIAVLQGDRAEMFEAQRVKYHLDIADQATMYFSGFDPTEEPEAQLEAEVAAAPPMRVIAQRKRCRGAP